MSVDKVHEERMSQIQVEITTDKIRLLQNKRSGPTRIETIGAQ